MLLNVEDPSKFIEDILKVHNEYRAIHGSPSLRIDEKLNERAQQLAESLLKKGEEEVVFEQAIPYGENIYIGFARDLNWKMQPEEPVQYWYEESRYYNYDAPRPRNVKHVRNFTQLVWKDSKLMGTAIVTGSTGKVYLVCSYDPAANIDGEFRRNVAPPREEDVQVASLDEMELTFTEPNEEVMRTMLRLYAVPSEKLRVWMVWLTGVVEITDEWHKWLRAHIDLIARIVERLQMAADRVPGGRKIESTVNAKHDKISDNVMPTANTERRDASPGFFDGETKENSYVTARTGLVSGQVANDVSPTEKVSLRKKAGELSDATTNETGRAGGEEKETAATIAGEKARKIATARPIGTRWRESSTPRAIEQEADQMKTIQTLKMPKNKAEMIELRKNFTHRAALYRSYYKHWRETADQAVKEIAGRTVIATEKFRGTGDSESAMDVAASQSAQYSMRQAESPVAHSTEGTTTTTTTMQPAAAAAPAAVTSSGIDPSATDLASGWDTADAPIALSNDQSEVVVEHFTAKGEMGPESPSAPRHRRMPVSKTTPKTFTMEAPAGPRDARDRRRRSSLVRGVAKREGAKQLVADTVRADEDIPYFFYLKVEPDMDIAIQYNDEMAILPDPDRECISANREYLRFDLTDEPEAKQLGL